MNIFIVVENQNTSKFPSDATYYYNHRDLNPRNHYSQVLKQILKIQTNSRSESKQIHTRFLTERVA